MIFKVYVQQNLSDFFNVIISVDRFALTRKKMPWDLNNRNKDTVENHFLLAWCLVQFWLGCKTTQFHEDFDSNLKEIVTVNNKAWMNIKNSNWKNISWLSYELKFDNGFWWSRK